jgi:hypothetical protein
LAAIGATISAMSRSERLFDLLHALRRHPWGNRSMLLRDPDGNRINIFAPIGRNA